MKKGDEVYYLVPPFDTVIAVGTIDNVLNNTAIYVRTGLAGHFIRTTSLMTKEQYNTQEQTVVYKHNKYEKEKLQFNEARDLVIANGISEKLLLGMIDMAEAYWEER